MPSASEKIEQFQNIIKSNDHNENSIHQFQKQELYQTMQYILEKKQNNRSIIELKFLISMTKGLKHIKDIILQQGGINIASEICREYSLKQQTAGEYVFQKGEPNRQLIMILSGTAIFENKQEEVQSSLQGQTSTLTRLECGSIIDLPKAKPKKKLSMHEDAIKTEEEEESYYENSLKCQSDCIYMVLMKEHLQKITLDFKLRLKIYDEFSSMNLFQGWNKSQIREMQDCFTEKEFNINNLVYKEGDDSNYLYIVKEGEFVQHKTIETCDGAQEAEKKEINSMINHIQSQNKKRSLFKDQETHLTAIEQQLKHINLQEAPQQLQVEDQIRKKKLKKKELKKIKILTQGETFGAEEFLQLLQDPQQRQQTQYVAKKRQLTTTCQSVQGILYIIHIKDILSKIAKNEDILGLILKSLKQKSQSSDNQVNLIKKQKTFAPKEVSVAKNLIFDSEEEEKYKEENKNVLRNYEYNEFKIEKHIILPGIKYDSLDNKHLLQQQQEKSEKNFIVSPIKLSKKTLSKIRMNDNMDKLNKQDILIPQETEIFERRQIIQKQSSLESPIKTPIDIKKNIIQNNENHQLIKKLISEYGYTSSHTLQKQKYSLNNLDTNPSLVQFQLEDDNKKGESLVLQKEDVKQRDHHFKDLYSVPKSLTNFNSVHGSIERFPIRHFRKTHNNLDYKFEQYPQSPKVTDQHSPSFLNFSNTQMGQTQKNSKVNLFKVNQMKQSFLSQINSFNANSPTSLQAQILVKTNSQDYHNHSSANSGYDSPKVIIFKDNRTPKAIVSCEQLTTTDRSKFFKANRMSEFLQKTQENTPKIQNSSQQHNHVDNKDFKIRNSHYFITDKHFTNDLSPLESFNTISHNKLKSESSLRNSLIFMMPNERQTDRQNNKQQISQASFTQKKVCSSGIVNNILPLKYHAEKLQNNSHSKLNLIPKNLKPHYKEIIKKEPDNFCLKSQSYKINNNNQE